jgi:hypothetical protein
MSFEDGELARLGSMLEAVQAQLDELAAVVERFDPDDVGRTRALAEDGLARADHALAVAGDALARAESRGADAEARADHAVARADDAASLAESAGADGLARADHAASQARDALARSESLGADALARADHAKGIAEDAVAQAKSVGADALARAGHAQDVAADAVARAESLGSDALARAESLGADALARADHALARAGDAVARADAAVEAGDQAVRASEFAAQAAREALLPARIAAFAGWLELRPPAEDLAVSIVLPTRDRPELLPRAVASVLAQRYRHWQLVVVDDGETGAVADVLGDVDDERVIVVEGPRRGLGAARNAGLDAATGEIVAYLDDDNVMHPGWLQAVAHVFVSREDIDVLYGVSIAERRLPDAATGDGWLPAFWQLPWSREDLLRENLTDAGALAHRRSLEAARFEATDSGEDWDLLIRLTVDRPAFALPAVSHAYAMEGVDRMSLDSRHRRALEDVRRRHTQ